MKMQLICESGVLLLCPGRNIRKKSVTAANRGVGRYTSVCIWQSVILHRYIYISWDTPKIIHVYDQKQYAQDDRSIFTTIHFILKQESLVVFGGHTHLLNLAAISVMSPRIVNSSIVKTNIFRIKVSKK